MRGIFTIIIIAVLIGIVILVARVETTTQLTPNKSDNTGDQSIIKPPLMPVSITLECEDGQITANAGETTLLTKKEHNEGRPIKYLEVAGDEDFKKSMWKDKFKSPPKPDENPPGMCRYEFEAPRDDTYYVNLRAKWFDLCGNSVWIKIDSDSYINLEDENGKISDKNFRWDWHQVVINGQPKGFELKQGKHILVMGLREHGMWLDKWLITTDAYRPIER
ncbi:MAG: hypothetical protein V1899_12985 [Planctomycetota bacterium]